MTTKKVNNQIKKYDARGLIVIEEYYSYMNEKKTVVPSYLELIKTTLDYFVSNDISINKDELKEYTDLYILKHNIPIFDVVQYVEKHFMFKL